jgi:hypothetical protein
VNKYSTDALDRKGNVFVDQHPGVILDFLGFAAPSIEDQLIEEEEEMNTIDTTLEEAAKLAAAEADELHDESNDIMDHSEVEVEVEQELRDKPLMRLEGRMFAIDIYDPLMPYDDYGMVRFITQMANDAQYTWATSQLFINDLEETAKNRRDPMSNAKNRIKVESDGDVIEEEIDYELDGLTPAMALAMAKSEDQIERAKTTIEDLQVWYNKFSDGKRPMLTMTIEQRMEAIIKSREKKESEHNRMALKEYMTQRKVAQTSRASRSAGVSVG